MQRCNSSINKTGIKTLKIVFWDEEWQKNAQKQNRYCENISGNIDLSSNKQKLSSLQLKEDYQTFEYNFIKQYYNAENNYSLSGQTINNKLDLKNIKNNDE